jgi:Spy/CpxP family protein refolding chaperone
MIAHITQKVTIMANMRADMMDKSLKVLTPEQRKKFVTLLQADNN